jgi:hypothetical protein
MREEINLEKIRDSMNMSSGSILRIVFERDVRNKHEHFSILKPKISKRTSKTVVEFKRKYFEAGSERGKNEEDI